MEQQISHYKILRKIGAGGMGEVYLAEDTLLERTVALKVLPSDVASNEDRMRRFVQEAKMASALKHSNIVPIYEIGEADGLRFIAMEFIEGETLETKINGRPLSTSQILEFGIQIADALDEAHSKGIIHRDIKSQNIMITNRGQVKILDFGLAKSTAVLQTPEVTHLETQTGTEPGMVLGTVQYMSPEQALGKSADARSDIFSLGIVLYQMATGVLPFQGKTSSETMNKIINAAPEAIARFNYDVTPDLERIIRRCLEKDPDRRYQSARDLLIDLKNLKRDTDSTGYSQAASVAKKEWSMKPVLIAAALLILIAGAIYFAMHRRDSIHSIAVLPFVNTSGNSQTEYLSDGITESTINSLSQIPTLKVMARSTVFRFKKNQQDPQKIGSDLKVDAVLTGTMDQQMDHLVINTELVKVSDGSQIWGQRFSRNLSDILAIQTEISNQIADQLKIRLSGEERKQLNKQSTVNPEAYQLYLQGRYQWNKRSREGFLKAIEYFNQAIGKDPSFARAYAGLADCYVTDSSPFPLDIRISHGKEAALKAIQLDPSLGEAETSLAGVYGMEWNWEANEKAFQRAIELNPNYPTAHQWYAEYLISTGKKKEAIQQIQKALELDPLSLIINSTTSFIYFYCRDYKKAEEFARKTLELDPHFVPAKDSLMTVLEQQHKIAEIFQYYENSNPDEQTRQDLKEAKKLYEEKGERVLLEYALQLKLTRGSSAYDVAVSYAELNDKEKALEYLDKAIQAREGGVVLMNVSPQFDNFRSDPRFQELVRRLNLPK